MYCTLDWPPRQLVIAPRQPSTRTTGRVNWAAARETLLLTAGAPAGLWSCDRLLCHSRQLHPASRITHHFRLGRSTTHPPPASSSSQRHLIYPSSTCHNHKLHLPPPLTTPSLPPTTTPPPCRPATPRPWLRIPRLQTRTITTAITNSASTASSTTMRRRTALLHRPPIPSRWITSPP